MHNVQLQCKIYKTKQAIAASWVALPAKQAQKHQPISITRSWPQSEEPHGQLPGHKAMWRDEMCTCAVCCAVALCCVLCAALYHWTLARRYLTVLSLVHVETWALARIVQDWASSPSNGSAFVAISDMATTTP